MLTEKHTRAMKLNKATAFFSDKLKMVASWAGLVRKDQGQNLEPARPSNPPNPGSAVQRPTSIATAQLGDALIVAPLREALRGRLPDVNPHFGPEGFGYQPIQVGSHRFDAAKDIAARKYVFACACEECAQGAKVITIDMNAVSSREQILAMVQAEIQGRVLRLPATVAQVENALYPLPGDGYQKPEVFPPSPRRRAVDLEE